MTHREGTVKSKNHQDGSLLRKTLCSEILTVLSFWGVDDKTSPFCQPGTQISKCRCMYRMGQLWRLLSYLEKSTERERSTVNEQAQRCNIVYIKTKTKKTVLNVRVTISVLCNVNSKTIVSELSITFPRDYLIIVLVTHRK